MRKIAISLFILCALIYSCKNKKAGLVDLEKKYSDSAAYYSRMRDASAINYASGTGSVKEEMLREKPIVEKWAEFKKLVDSIERELRKY
jgi:hypothetical protein